MGLKLKIARKAYDFCAKRVLKDNSIRHMKASIIYSPEGQTLSEYLVEVVSSSLKVAAVDALTCGRSDLPDSQFLNVFPGEHYRLLAALVKTANMKNIVEIGTFTGMGTLALREGLQEGGTVHTYDITPWNELRVPSHFAPTDFEDGRLQQHIGDLSDDGFFEENFDILNNADLIFMDAPKDDRFEYRMLEKVSRLDKRKGKLLLVDDIRFVNMIDFWRSITSPKMDISTFGHWSGTGLVDISDGLKFRT